MTDRHFTFQTNAFVDPPEILAQNVNGISGHTLAAWLSVELKRHGLDASEPWAEDHGWDFSVAHNGAKYLCVCSIAEDDNPPTEGHVTVHKSRSFMDRMTGKGKLANDDQVAAAVHDALAKSRDVAKLEVET